MIERGQSLAIPEELITPETGIPIELPPQHRFVYVVVSLAYYLGATVRPGSPPKIITSGGFEHPLDTEGGVQAKIERVLIERARGADDPVFAEGRADEL